MVLPVIQYNTITFSGKEGLFLNFLNINYFLAIVEEGSISAAARKLYISQQALSEQLRKMEKEVGAPLFMRGKNATLTVAGECLYRNGKELLHIYENMMEDIQDITSNRRRKVTVGIPTFWTPPYLPDLLTNFRSKYPEYEIAVVKRQHTDVEHNMTGVDLYMSSLPLSPHLENIVIRDSDPFHVTFRRDLAEKVFQNRWIAVENQLIQTQDLSAIKNMPFIALRDRYGQLVQSLNLIFNEYHFSPSIGFNSESFDLNEHACINGLGCLLTTQSHIEHLFHRIGNQANELLSYPIKVTSFETKMAISHRKGLHLHAAEVRFIEEAKKLINHLE